VPACGKFMALAPMHTGTVGARLRIHVPRCQQVLLRIPHRNSRGQGVDMAVQLSSLPFFCLCPMVSDIGVATVRVLPSFDRNHAAGSNEWRRAGFGPISPFWGPTYLSRCLMIRIQNPATRVILHSFPEQLESFDSNIINTKC
jgi:hypothetical protein